MEKKRIDHLGQGRRVRLGVEEGVESLLARSKEKVRPAYGSTSIHLNGKSGGHTKKKRKGDGQEGKIREERAFPPVSSEREQASRQKGEVMRTALRMGSGKKLTIVVEKKERRELKIP